MRYENEVNFVLHIDLPIHQEYRTQARRCNTYRHILNSTFRVSVHRFSSRSLSLLLTIRLRLMSSLSFFCSTVFFRIWAVKCQWMNFEAVSLYSMSTNKHTRIAFNTPK